MKKKRITCPICKKRIMDIGINGDASMKMKCHHCGKIVKIQCSNQPLEDRSTSPPTEPTT